MTQKTRWSILEIDPPYYACRVQSIPSQRDCHPAAHDLGDRSEGKLKRCPECNGDINTRAKALWRAPLADKHRGVMGRPYRIDLHRRRGLSLVVRFFGGH
jgi:hypothetical protein